MSEIDYRSCEWYFLPVNPLCTTTTSTTVSTTTTTTTRHIIPCLEGLVIESIYLYSQSDLLLLPEGYTHPCTSSIGIHLCNRAFFEVYGNGIYMADSLMNNADGNVGEITHSGKYTCTDYYNLPDDLTGGTWTGNILSRYSKTVLTHQQAIDIANAGGGGTTIDISLLSTMILYSSMCDGQIYPHSDVTWLRISNSTGQVLWNSCIEGQSIHTIDVCNTTTTTTTIR